jgi:hypothetical protein
MRAQLMDAQLSSLHRCWIDVGAQVRMLIWDDRSSLGINVPWLKSMSTAGVMKTFDEETRQWFAANAPAVECELVGRSGGEGNSILEGQTAATCFSHHQVRACGGL